METLGIVLNPLDLTGQLSVLDYMPKFTGNYSSVYLGGLNGNFVAIKVIKPKGREESVKRKLIREILLWASTSHPNIQPFYGFATDPGFGAFGALVSPWCLNGDATVHLQENGGRMVMAERINLWKGVIDGVAYLHHQNPIIIHGDLKPGNILIGDLGVPRIYDFGLARVFLEAESTGITTTSEHTGTARYLAPELVASEENVYPTAASDVYALGCLGLEFIYDQKPYSNRANNLRGQIVRDIKRSLPPAPGPPHQGWAYQHTWSLIQHMWSLDPSDRPSASNAVSVLNHTARSIPPVVIQRVVRFSASLNGLTYTASTWNRRAQTLLTLSLVSKLFCASATPLLYRDIRLCSKVTASRLSKLAVTLNSSVKHFRTPDYLLNRYGSYTKALFLCVDEDTPALSADISNLLYKMSGLHILAIHPNENFIWDKSFLNTPFLSAMYLGGVQATSVILDREVIQALLSFQRIVIHYQFGLNFGLHDTLQMTSVPLLLPNLQDINLRLEISATIPFRVFTKWVMPRLKSLNCTLVGFYQESCAALTNFLRTHGPLLWFPKVELIGGGYPPVLDILSLCSNLRSFGVVAHAHIEMSSFPPHPRLEILSVGCNHYARGVSEDPYLTRFEELVGSWRARFPNLRCANFKGGVFSSHLTRYQVDVEINFRTGHNFYTLIVGGATYKRWEGSWLGAGTPTIHLANSTEPNLELSLPISGPAEGARFYNPMGDEEILEESTGVTSGMILS